MISLEIIRAAIGFAPNGFRDDDGVWQIHNIKDTALEELEKMTKEIDWLHSIILEHVGTDARNVDEEGYERIFGKDATTPTTG